MCSEDKMDEINKDVNNALTMVAQSELPDAILPKSALKPQALILPGMLQYMLNTAPVHGLSQLMLTDV